MQTLSGTSSRRRAIRASLRRDAVSCEMLCESISSDWIRVHDISELGAAIRINDKDLPALSAQTFNARLFFDNKVACPVRLRVVYVKGDLIGLEFIDPSSHLKSLVKHFFEPEFLGAGLKLKKIAARVKASVLSYGDERENHIDVLLKGQTLAGLSVWIPELEAQVEWMALDLPTRPIEGSPHAQTVLRVIHNLADLDQGVRQQIERFLIQ